MAGPRIVIDTGVLWRTEAMERLAHTYLPLVLPSVAYMERARQIRRDGGDVKRFRRWLSTMHIEIEPFTEDEADRLPIRIENDRLWKRLVRDAMIAGHVEQMDLLWTTNPKDFLAVGMDPDRIVGV